MKPTDKQKEFIRELRKVLDENLKHWETTNDITSPSHYTLIEDSLDNLSETFDLKKSQIEVLSDGIDLIYNVLKTIK